MPLAASANNVVCERIGRKPCDQLEADDKRPNRARGTVRTEDQPSRYGYHHRRYVDRNDQHAQGGFKRLVAVTGALDASHKEAQTERENAGY